MHEHWMRQALSQAELGRYSALPNPMVGCVIVKNGEMLNQGFHLQPGTAHAEVHALAGINAEGATVYVSLEPCCHQGRTPPCTDALIQAKVKTVYVACLDPNPLVAGKGVKTLQEHGIEVHVGLLEAEARELNRIFFHYITTQTPYIVAKWAMSLDGKMAVNPGDDRTLSSPESLQDLHELRQRLPGILVGAETARLDNPSLTVRSADVVRQPQRIVLNTQADLPSTLKLFDGSLPGQTWLVCAEAKADFAQKRFPAEFTLILPCATQNGQIDLNVLLKILGKREIAGVLVEGGKQIHNSFFHHQLVSEVVTYLTPWIIGNLPHKLPLQSLSQQQLGADCKITARLLP